MIAKVAVTANPSFEISATCTRAAGVQMQYFALLMPNKKSMQRLIVCQSYFIVPWTWRWALQGTCQGDAQRRLAHSRWPSAYDSWQGRKGCCRECPCHQQWLQQHQPARAHDSNARNTNGTPACCQDDHEHKPWSRTARPRLMELYWK